MRSVLEWLWHRSEGKVWGWRGQSTILNSVDVSEQGKGGDFWAPFQQSLQRKFICQNPTSLHPILLSVTGLKKARE